MNDQIQLEINAVIQELQKEGLTQDEACDVFMAVLPSLITYTVYYKPMELKKTTING